jgi:membrane-associated phospholipid phosphatase
MSKRVHRLIGLAGGFALALLAVLLVAYYVGPAGRADAAALHGLSTLGLDHRWIWRIGDVLVHSVDLVFMIPMLALIVAAGIAWGRRRQALGALVLVAGASFLTLVIKVVAAHPRFYPVLEPHQLSVRSFPSGHATAAMSLALAAVLVVPSRWRPLTAFAAGSFALAVCLALVIQEWHFPSDVVGGSLVVGLVTTLVLAGLAVTEGESPRLAETSASRLRRAALVAVQIGLLGLTVAAGMLLATHPNAFTSWVSANPSAAVAAIGIAVVSLGIVSAVTAELEAG